MGTIDLDAARAARAEMGLESHSVVYGGQRFELPAEFPFKVAELWNQRRMGEAIDLLLGNQAEAFWALIPPPSTDDTSALLAGLAEEYGFGGGSGESSASNGSSPSTSSRSRPTSPASTG